MNCVFQLNTKEDGGYHPSSDKKTGRIKRVWEYESILILYSHHGSLSLSYFTFFGCALIKQYPKKCCYEGQPLDSLHRKTIAKRTTVSSNAYV